MCLGGSCDLKLYLWYRTECREQNCRTLGFHMKWLQIICNTNQYLQIALRHMMEACGHPKKACGSHSLWLWRWYWFLSLILHLKTRAQEHVAGAAEELWNCKPNTKPQPYVTPGKPSGHYIFSFLVKEDKAEADGMWAKFQPEYIAF